MAKSLEELRADLLAATALDPKEAAKQLLGAANDLAIILQMSRAAGLSKETSAEIMLDMFAEHHAIYRAKVEEALLASQQQTNDALASALGMRGQK